MSQDVELSPAQRAEIARAQVFEPAHKIAERLGLSKHVVKDEIHRVRSGRRVATSSGRLRIFALVATGLVGVGLGLSARRASQGPVLSVAPVVTSAPAKESERAKELYALMDRNKRPEATELKRDLEHGDPAVRLAAIRAYAQVPAADREPAPLLARLNDAEERVRFATLHALATLRDPRAVPSLAAVTRSSRSVTERTLALDALASVRSETSLPPLLAALTDKAVNRRAFELLTRRFGSSLGCKAEQLDKEPERVRAIFARHAEERRS